MSKLYSGPAGESKTSRRPRGTLRGPRRRGVVAPGHLVRPGSGQHLPHRDAADLAAVEDDGDVLVGAVLAVFGVGWHLRRAARAAVHVDPPTGQVHDPVDRDARPGIVPERLAVVVGQASVGHLDDQGNVPGRRVTTEVVLLD